MKTQEYLFKHVLDLAKICTLVIFFFPDIHRPTDSDHKIFSIWMRYLKELALELANKLQGLDAKEVFTREVEASLLEKDNGDSIKTQRTKP